MSLSPESGSDPKPVFLILGAAAVLAQVILLRKLLAVFSGNELTLGSVLAGWMVWTGLASALLGPAADKIRKPAPLLAGVLLLAALILPLTTLAAARIKPWLGHDPSELVGLPVVILASFLITGPLCALLGFSFNLCSRLVAEERLAVPRVYLWEALGAGAAGAGFTFLLAGRTSAFAQVHLTSGLLLLGAGLVLKPRALRIGGAVFAVLAALLGLLLPGDYSLDRVYQRLRWPGEKVLFETDSPYASLAVIEREAERTFFVDGLPAFTTPNPEPAEYVAHLPLSMCPTPRRVLLIGGGLYDVAGEILKHPVARLDYVQIDPALTRLEESYGLAAEKLKSDRRIQIHHEDARRFLLNSAERWDAVILNLPPPESAQLNRFYTADFFRRVRDHLERGGVLGLAGGEAGNYLTEAQAALLATLRNTLLGVFDRVVVLPLGSFYLVAGDAGGKIGGEAAAETTGTPSPLTDDPRRLLAVLQARQVQTRWVRDYYLNANLSAERLNSVARRISGLSRLPLNRDLYPRGYFLGLELWAEQAGPGVVRLLDRAGRLSRAGLAWPAVLLVVIGVALGRRPRWAKPGAAVIAVLALGFAGMAAEVAVMTAFQVIQGYVYQLLGLIVAAFMAGLAAGAGWGQGQTRSRSGPSLAWLGRLQVLLLLALLLVWLVILRLHAGTPSGLATALALSAALFCLAAVSGGLFSLAAAIFIGARKKVGDTAGWINGADHLGGALGALLSSAVIIPVFGLADALGFSALLTAAALAVVLAAMLRGRKEG